MRAFALLGLVLAAPAMAQKPAPRPPEEAVKVAVEQCVQHARNVLAIETQNGNELDAKGLIYQRDPPEFLAQTRSSQLGVGQYAHSLSTEGEIWAVGYDGTANGCMVVTLATPIELVEKVYAEIFGVKNTWRAERSSAAARPGERTTRYAWDPNRNTKLSAVVTLRDEAGVSTVTVLRRTDR